MPLFKRKDRSKPRHVLARKRIWLSIFLLGFFGLLVSCSGTRVLMQTASSKPKGAPATPPITATSLEDWQAQVPDIQTAFETHVYGPVPKDLALIETGRNQMDGVHFDTSARSLTRSRGQ